MGIIHIVQEVLIEDKIHILCNAITFAKVFYLFVVLMDFQPMQRFGIAVEVFDIALVRGCFNLFILVVTA